MKQAEKVISGAGGGGKSGGGSARVAQQQQQYNQSTQVAEFIEVLTEGPVFGPAIEPGDDPLKCVYYDETPIKNPDGTSNFGDVTFLWRNGYPSQTALEGMTETASTQAVGVQVKKAQPITRTLSLDNIDHIVVTLGFPRLAQQNKENGDLNAASVRYKIEVQQNGGGFVHWYDETLTDAIYSRYQKDYKIPVAGKGPFDIRVTRVTDDSTDEALSNDLYFDAITGIIDQVFTYPNTAFVGTRINAEQFEAIPSRAYDWKGLIIEVPVNYDPILRTYDGVWNGQFKLAWSDNPAWCFRDLVLNTRYGLGDFVNDSELNKWELYQIAQHCDQMVDDGYGGKEPRFTCNMYLQSQEEAHEVITNMASIFRAMVYWGAGAISLSQDRPVDTYVQYTNSDVIDGKFVYQGADSKQIHNVAYVTWNDPQDMYRLKPEYVQLDDAEISKHGILQLDMAAVGCTSRGQAIRLGRYALLSERMAEIVTFSIGLNTQSVIYPGMIIKTTDVKRAGKPRGGRVKAGSTAGQIILDREIDFGDGSEGFTISIPDENGKFVVGNVATTGKSKVVNLTSAFEFTPVPGSSFVISSTNLVPEQWRVVGLSEDDKEPGVLNVSAVTHNPSKYDAIEKNLKLEPMPVSQIKGRPQTPTDLRLSTKNYTVDGSVTGLSAVFSWSSSDSAVFNVRYRSNYGAWARRDNVRAKSITIDNMTPGQYTFQVVAVNILGVQSEVATLDSNVTPAPNTLDDVTNLRLDGEFTASNLAVIWDAVSGATGYTVQVWAGGALRKTKAVGNTLRFEYTVKELREDGGPWRDITILVKATGAYGAISQNWAEVSISNPQIGLLQGMQIEGIPKSISFLCDTPTDDDFAGILLWVSDSSTFVPSLANRTLDVKGTNRATVYKINDQLLENKDYYVWAAGYDTFGQDNLNISASVKVTPMVIPLDEGSIQDYMIADGSLSITKLADNIKPPVVMSALPATGKPGDRVFLSTNEKTYTWRGGKWDATVKADEVPEVNVDALLGKIDIGNIPEIPTNMLAGTISTAQIANSAIDNTKIAANLDLVKNVTALPTTRLDTDTVAYQGQLYTWNATTGKYESKIKAIDVTGQLTNEQIAAIDAAKLQGKVTAEKIDSITAVQVTGQLTNDQLKDIAAAKITGTISSGQIAAKAIDSTKIASGLNLVKNYTTLPTTRQETDTITFQGQLYTWNAATSRYESKVKAVDVVGQLTSDQISKIAAAKVDGQLKDSQIEAIDATKLTGEIVSTQIKDGAIGAGKLASGLEAIKVVTALPAAKVGSHVSFNGELYRWDGAKYVKSVKASDVSGQLTSEQIADLAATKISGTLTDAQLSAISATKINGAIQDSQIAAVSASKLSGLINSAQIDKVDAGKIAGKLTAAQIDKIAATQISGKLTNAQLEDIQATKIAGTLTDAQLAGISAAKVSGNLVNASIPTSGLQGKISDDQINALSAAKLTGTITETQISDNAISTPKIAAGAIVADKIAVSAVTTEKLTITPSNLIPNSDFATGDFTNWYPLTGSYTITPMPDAPSKYVAMLNQNNGQQSSVFTHQFAYTHANSAKDGIVVAEGEKYFVSISCARAWDLTFTTAEVVAYGLKPDGGVANLGRAVDMSALERSIWKSFSGEFTVPAGILRVWLLVRFVGTEGFMVFTNLRCVKKASSELIVDGAVLTEKLAANAVTAGKIAAKTITANEIAAGTISADELGANSVTAVKISANAVTATKVAAGAIIAGKLAANSVQAGNIVADAVTSDKIAANSVTTAKIAAGAVTATEILSGAVTTSKLEALAVTADKLAVNSVDASKIQVGAITADHLRAGSITASKLAIADYSNIIPDATFDDFPASWGNRTNVSRGVGYGSLSQYKYMVNLLPGTAAAGSFLIANAHTPQLPIEAGKSYYISTGCYLSSAVEAGGFVGIYVFRMDAAGAIIGSELIASRSQIGTGEIGAIYTVPSGVTGLVIGFQRRVSTLGGTSSGAVHIFNPVMRRAASGELIVDGAITTNSLAANAVTAAKIAAKTITAAEIASQTISANEIAANAITTAKIDTKAITTAKIAANAVTANEIAAKTITSAEIKAGTLTANELAANSVTASQIAADAVTTAAIAAGAVKADQIAAGAITTSKLVVTDGSNLIPDPYLNEDFKNWTTVRDVRIRAGYGSLAAHTKMFDLGWGTAVGDVLATASTAPIPVESGKQYYFSCVGYLSPNNVSEGSYLEVCAYYQDGNGAHLSSAVLTSMRDAGVREMSGIFTPPANAKTMTWQIRSRVATSGGSTAGTIHAAAPVLRRAVSGELIVDGAVTANSIAAKSITTSKIAANAVTANEIAAKTITSAEIKAGTLTAAELAAGSIITDKLAANAVTTEKIATNAVTANEIAANTITAANMAANSITTAAIAAGAVKADQIAAGAISASKLVVSDTSNIILDAALTDPQAWVFTKNPGVVGDGWIINTGGSSYSSGNYLFFATDTQTAAANTNWLGGAQSLPVPVESNKEYVFGARVTMESAGTGGDLQLFLDARDRSGTTIQQFKLGPFTPTFVNQYVSMTAKVPANTATVVFRARRGTLVNGGTAKGWVIVSDPFIRRASNAELIVDGAIVADKIAASAVTTDKIAANAVTANQIAANTITATEIAAGAIQTSELATNAVTAVKIAAKAVTAGKIAANAVTATEIAAGTIVADNIASNAITTAKIATNAVTSNEIAANTITAGNMAAGSITTAALAAGAVKADQIAAGAITASKLVVSDTTNLVPDALLNDFANAWGNKANAEVIAGYGSLAAYKNMINLLPGTASGTVVGNAHTVAIPVEIGQTYYVSTEGYMSSGTDAGTYAGIYIFRLDASGSILGSELLTRIYGSQVTGQFNIGLQYTVPAGVTSLIIGYQRRVSTAGSASTGAVYVFNPSVRRVNGSELIVDGAIVANKIAANAVTTEKIATNSVTSNEIAANTIKAGNIAANAITTDKIYANAVTTAKIATNAVTANEIASRTITANNIATGAITANELAADSVVAGKVAAGAIGADQIRANAISTSKLTLTGNNLVPNSDFATGDLTNWSTYSAPTKIAVMAYNSANSAAAINAMPTQYACRFMASGSASNVSVFTGDSAYTNEEFGKGAINCKEGETYYVSIDAIRNGTGFATFQVAAYYLANSGRSGSTQIISLTPTQINDAAYGTYEGKFTIPAGKIKFKLYVIANSMSGGYIYWTNLRCIQMMSSELVVDGSIKTQHMIANSIQGDRIQANTLAGDRIIANSIQGDRIIADTLDGNRIKANTIDASKINVTNLGALNANLGVVYGGIISMNNATSDGWSYIRSGPDKWYEQGYGYFFGKNTIENSRWFEVNAGGSYFKMFHNTSTNTAASALRFGTASDESLFYVDSTGYMRIDAVDVNGRLQIRGGSVTTMNVWDLSGGLYNGESNLGHVLWSAQLGNSEPANLVLVYDLFRVSLSAASFGMYLYVNDTIVDRINDGDVTIDKLRRSRAYQVPAWSQISLRGGVTSGNRNDGARIAALIAYR